MKRILSFLKNFISKTFLLYTIIGIINTLHTAGYSALLSLIINEHTASYLGYGLSLSVGYLLNAKLNFHHRISLIEYLRFMASYIPNFIIYAVISSFAISVWNLPPFFATVLAAVAGVPITYLLMRFFAFGSEKYRQPTKDDDI